MTIEEHSRMNHTEKWSWKKKGAYKTYHAYCWNYFCHFIYCGNGSWTIPENKPPTLSDSLIGATLAALVAFGIEACIIMREHNL